MTAEEAVISMLGGSDIIQLPLSRVQYYDYQTTIYDYGYNGSSSEYGETRTIPKDSIVLNYYKSWYNASGRYCYKDVYKIYQLIIDDIDTETEEVVGIKDLQTDTEYRFQFNVKGGR